MDAAAALAVADAKLCSCLTATSGAAERWQATSALLSRLKRNAALTAERRMLPALADGVLAVPASDLFSFCGGAAWSRAKQARPSVPFWCRHASAAPAAATLRFSYAGKVRLDLAAQQPAGTGNITASAHHIRHYRIELA